MKTSAGRRPEPEVSGSVQTQQNAFILKDGQIVRQTDSGEFSITAVERQQRYTKAIDPAGTGNILAAKGLIQLNYSG